MDTQQIVQELEAERDRIETAIGALKTKFVERPHADPRLVKGRRRLSTAAKKAISEMMKKRWAERKRAAKAA